MINSTGRNILYGTSAGLLVLLVILAAAPSTHAAEGGSSNYIPGFYGDFGVAVAPDPGFYWQNNFYYYTAGADRVVQGGKLKVDLDVDVFMYMPVGLMALDKNVLGGRYAFGVYLPLVYQDLTTRVALDQMSASVEDSLTAIGDMGLIPISLFWSIGKTFSLNASETITVPIGSYENDRPLNAGLNYWSFDTNLAATYLNSKSGVEISADIGYIYNSKNDATDYQTGQEFHLDYMLNLFLSEAFALGVQGFYYQQVTGDSGSGAILGDFKGEAAGVGPALMWATQINDVGMILGVKWLHEFQAEHRLQGDNLYLNLTFAF